MARTGRPRTSRCSKGHDLSDPANVYTVPSTGKRSCRECNRQHRRNYRDRKRGGKVRHMVLLVDSCVSCGREKYLDTRKLCFGCSLNGRVSPGSRTEQILSDRIEIECAPQWVKRNPYEHRRWLEQRKREAMRQR